MPANPAYDTPHPMTVKEGTRPSCYNREPLKRMVYSDEFCYWYEQRTTVECQARKEIKDCEGCTAE